jgi:membrane-bound metal-dependent hydrolase YbcI (DUF457 family)
MILGHALLAFAIAATLAGQFVRPERAIRFGVIGGAFAAVPDVDVAYGLIGAMDALGGTGPVIESFWAAGLLTHRGLTHSVLVGAIAAVAFGLLGTAEGLSTSTVAGAALLVGIVVLGALGGPLAALSAGLFVAIGVVIARIGAVRYGAGSAQITGLAAIGLLSHPFGDLFTGDPPALLYPFTPGLVPERIALAGEPTLHLLGTFGLELLAAWLALLVLTRSRDRHLSELIAPRALAGATFGIAALVLAPPTLERPYRFTASVVPIAAGVGASCWIRPPIQWERPETITVVSTGLTALSVALVAYTVVFVVF